MKKIFVKGIFIEETKNRFLCTVNIDGNQEVCYISSSSKLSHFICLQEREVLLIKNISNGSKTKYTLHAVKTEKGYVLLNLSYINKLLLNEFNKLEHKYSSLGRVIPEKKINSALKVDFFIDGEKGILVEAKGILTEEDTARFPAMRVMRAENQLLQFEELLNKKIDIHYYIVLMNSEIRSIELNSEYREFVHLFKKCIKKGMQLYIYRAVWQGEFTVIRDLELENYLKLSM